MRRTWPATTGASILEYVRTGSRDGPDGDARSSPPCTTRRPARSSCSTRSTTRACPVSRRSAGSGATRSGCHPGDELVAFARRRASSVETLAGALRPRAHSARRRSGDPRRAPWPRWRRAGRSVDYRSARWYRRVIASQIRLLIVEDVPQVAQYIRGLLNSQSAIKLLDVVTDGAKAAGADPAASARRDRRRRAAPGPGQGPPGRRVHRRGPASASR